MYIIVHYPFPFITYSLGNTNNEPKLSGQHYRLPQCATNCLIRDCKKGMKTEFRALLIKKSVGKGSVKFRLNEKNANKFVFFGERNLSKKAVYKRENRISPI